MSRHKKLTNAEIIKMLENINSDESEVDDDFSDENEANDEYIPPPSSVSSFDSEEDESSNLTRNDDSTAQTSSSENIDASTSTVMSKDGTSWKKGSNLNLQGRLASQNIFRIHPGPTSFAFRNIKLG